MAQKKRAATQVAKMIVAAQIASDAGKDIYRLSMHGNNKALQERAERMAYEAKDTYILEAIKTIDSNPYMGWNYYVCKAKDQNGYPSYITYFTLKHEGKNIQVSFHTPANIGGVTFKQKVGSGTRQFWRYNKRTGSASHCSELIKIFNL